MPFLIFKRQAAGRLLRERTERVNLYLLEYVDPGKSRYPLVVRKTWDYDWRAMNGPDHYHEAERLLEELSPARSLVPGRCGA